MDRIKVIRAAFEKANEEEVLLPEYIINKSNEELEGLIFYHGKNNKRLKNYGFYILRLVFEHYDINIKLQSKDNQITSFANKHYLFLNKEMNFPYFLDEKRMTISLFDKNDAVRLKLVDGNLEKLVQSHKRKIYKN